VLEDLFLDQNQSFVPPIGKQNKQTEKNKKIRTPHTTWEKGMMKRHNCHAGPQCSFDE